MSWRSSKSTADSRSFAILYAVSKPWRSVLQEQPVPGCDVVERCLLDRRDGVGEGGHPADRRRVAGHRQLGQVEQRVGRRRERDELERALEHRPRRLARLVLQGFLCERRSSATRSASALSPPSARSSGRPEERRRSKTPMSIVFSPRDHRSRAAAAARARGRDRTCSAPSVKASVRSTRAWPSSSTRNRGSSPASNGWARRSREQKP